MKKVLWVSHTSNFVKFNKLFMKMFLDYGWQVDYASAEEEAFPEELCTNHYKVNFSRSPYSKSNIDAYKKLKVIIENGNYDLIHCHTPIGGVVARLAAKSARKKGTKVIYTAHGFHFYKGGPLSSWLLYYPVEKYLAKFTDCLITINPEDFNIAVENNFKAKKIVQIDGVGVDFNKYHTVSQEEKIALKKEYGYANNDLILNYTAELNPNKNQAFLFECVEKIKKEIPSVILLLCGEGGYRARYQNLISEKGLNDNVKLLGYRNDVNKICQLSDICVASSIREGLSFSVIESIACGEVAVATNNRGHRTIIKDGVNGFLINVGDVDGFVEKILQVHNNPQLRSEIFSKQFDGLEKFNIDNALKNIEKIYNDVLGYSIKE